METSPIPAPGPEGIKWNKIPGRAVLFWLIMVLLAVVLWKMAGTSSKPAAPAAPAMTYSDFLNQVDNKNIQAVTVYPGRNTTGVRGKLRNNGGEFATTVPTETLSALTDKLRSQGATVEVQGGSGGGGWNRVENALPVILLFAVWVFAMVRRTQRRTAGK